MADVGEMDVEPQEQAATSVDNSNDAPAPAPDAHEEEPAQEPAGASHREEIVPDPETQPEEGSSSTAGRKNEVTVKVLMLDGTYVSFPCQVHEERGRERGREGKGKGGRREGGGRERGEGGREGGRGGKDTEWDKETKKGIQLSLGETIGTYLSNCVIYRPTLTSHCY